MLDNSLKPTLRLKFPPPSPTKISAGPKEAAPTAPPAPTPPTTEPALPEQKAKKKPFKLVYLLKD